MVSHGGYLFRGSRGIYTDILIESHAYRILNQKVDTSIGAKEWYNTRAMQAPQGKTVSLQARGLKTPETYRGI